MRELKMDRFTYAYLAISLTLKSQFAMSLLTMTSNEGRSGAEGCYLRGTGDGNSFASQYRSIELSNPAQMRYCPFRVRHLRYGGVAGETTGSSRGTSRMLLGNHVRLQWLSARDWTTRDITFATIDRWHLLQRHCDIKPLIQTWRPLPPSRQPSRGRRTDATNPPNRTYSGHSSRRSLDLLRLNQTRE